MNVSIETMSGLERRLTIALSSEDFEERITARLQEARGQVQLPGFRPGKVPLKEVRRRFGPAVRAEVAGELMQASFFEAVEQEKLVPAGAPKLEVVKMEPGIDFEFTATFEVLPAPELADLSKFEIKSPQAEITDDDLEAMVHKLRAQRTTFVEVERPAAEGDQVTVDFTGTHNGEPVEGVDGEGAVFHIGEGQMIDDFDAALCGLEAGATAEFDATFPDDYPAEELQSKTLHFTVHVVTVKEVTEPALDEEFFREFGVEDGQEESFRQEVRDNMQRELDASIKNQLKQQVIDEIAKRHEIHLPAAAVHREIHTMKEQMMGQLQMDRRGKADGLPDELFREQAEKRVTVGLVVKEIIETQDIELAEEQLEERLRELAASYSEPEQVISWYRDNPEEMRNLERAVLEDQVIDNILAMAQVETVVSSYSEVISGRAIAPEDEDPGLEELIVDAPEEEEPGLEELIAEAELEEAETAITEAETAITEAKAAAGAKSADAPADKS